MRCLDLQPGFCFFGTDSVIVHATIILLTGINMFNIRIHCEKLLKVFIFPTVPIMHTFEKRSILPKVEEDENSNLRDSLTVLED